MSRTPFSIKALLLSVLFVVVAVGRVGLSELAEKQNEMIEVSPHIELLKGEGVSLITQKNQKQLMTGDLEPIFTGDQVKTGEGASVQLKFGHSRLILDENTQVELTGFYASPELTHYPALAPLNLELLEGRVWVESVEGVSIKASNQQVQLAQSVGVISLNEDQTHLKTLQGNMRVAFLSEGNEEQGSVSLPVYNQLTLTAASWNDEYAGLEDFERQESLEMAALIPDGWVTQQWDIYKNTRLRQGDWPTVSSSSYVLKKNYYQLLLGLNITQLREVEIHTRLSNLVLAHILGPVHERSDLKKAQSLLEKVKSTNAEFKGAELLINLREASPETPAFLVKEYLINQLKNTQRTHLFSLYLADVQGALQSQNKSQAEWVVSRWESAWTDDLIQKNQEEYSRQSQQLAHIFLNHIDLISLDLLDAFNRMGQRHLQYAEVPEAIRYQVVKQRLDLTQAMVDRYQYILAEEYLGRSYGQLGIDMDDQTSKVTQLFQSQGNLLAQKIDYAMETLHGAAQPIDEIQFEAFVESKQKESALADELRGLLEEEVSDQVALPTIEQVRERFLEAGIVTSVVDIVPLAGSPFEFQIQKAALETNVSVNFGGQYDFASNTMSQVQVADRLYKNSVSLNELEKLFDSQSFVARGGGPKLPGSSLDSLLSNENNVLAAEDQALAEDLAVKLAITQLEEAGMTVSILRSNVQVLNKQVLNEFLVKEVQFIDPENEKEWVTVELNYSTSTQMATQIKTQEGDLLVDSVSRENLKPSLEQAIVTHRENERRQEDFLRLARRSDLEIIDKNVTAEPGGTLKLVDLTLSTLPLSVSAIYDPETEQFITAFHPLYTGKNIELEAYFETLVDRFIISHLATQGVQIEAENITTNYPFRSIQLKNVSINNLLFDFSLDTETLEPTGVRVVETGVSLGDVSLEALKDFIED